MMKKIFCLSLLLALMAPLTWAQESPTPDTPPPQTALPEPDRAEEQASPEAPEEAESPAPKSKPKKSVYQGPHHMLYLFSGWAPFETSDNHPETEEELREKGSLTYQGAVFCPFRNGPVCHGIIGLKGRLESTYWNGETGEEIPLDSEFSLGGPYLGVALEPNFEFGLSLLGGYTEDRRINGFGLARASLTFIPKSLWGLMVGVDYSFLTMELNEGYDWIRKTELLIEIHAGWAF